MAWHALGPEAGRIPVPSGKCEKVSLWLVPSQEENQEQNGGDSAGADHVAMFAT